MLNRLLVTGGAGFIGSHVVDMLIQDYRIFVIDNLATGRLSNVNPKVQQFFDLSIADEATKMIIEDWQPDIVVHCAASYKDPNNWEEDIRTNVLGAKNVVEGCKLGGVKRLIYMQTSLCYGMPQTTPITLDHPINPQNSYAITKTAAEQFIRMSGLDFVSFRLENIYGPRNLAGAVPAFYKKLSKAEKCTVYDTKRSLVYVDYLLEHISKAIFGVGSGIYHISAGYQIKIEDVMLEVANAMGIEHPDYELLERLPEDVPSIMLDNSRTLQDFGEIPNEVYLREGIRRAVEWYTRYGVNEVSTHLPIINK